ncbi:HAD family hydrolase [uncultured Sphingomonas sp.]|uniref:HAD family hydrolase n=1 Tax=uncultured Sphingomonas sp. TaxID=158754 RepID=UPI0025EF629D|nr:HAD family hydrolase [uncultured Sphingomonas sp.]
MTRPLLITDCDEVLVHMVRHFADWLDQEHAVDFSYNSWELAKNMRRRTGEPLTQEEMWDFLHGFFPDQMHRQTIVPHAREAIAALSKQADVVILTNLQDQCQTHRVEQLAAFGIPHRVVCNQGGKGTPVAALVAEYAPSVAVFVDDLPVHHQSVADHAPDVWRLHMVSEPQLAAGIAPAAHAHARIDDWQQGQAWIAARFAAAEPAPPIEALATT